MLFKVQVQAVNLFLLNTIDIVKLYLVFEAKLDLTKFSSNVRERPATHDN